MIEGEEPGTLRERIRRSLREQELNVRELSQRLSAAEREVRDALPHVARTVEAAGGRFAITPPSCAGCRFVFEDRVRPGKPSRCPRCKGTRIFAPSFRVEEA